MADSWSNVSRQRLMETIVILWTLTEVPGGPNVQKPTCLPSENQGTRQLTFEQEKGLVEILAFLSGTADDPSKVMAVCIEESSAGDSLTIRLAANSGGCSDVLSGFRRIAKILEQSSRREKQRGVASHELLREIVRLDFWRILSRLRSIHAKRSRKTGKPSLVLQLSAAVKSNLRLRGKKLSAEKEAALRKGVQNILTLVISLEAIPEIDDGSSQAQDILMDIVERFSELDTDETLAILLEKVIDLDPGVKSHLKSAVGKLGRYYFACGDLIRAARTKRYSIFNRIFVEEYQLPPPPASHLLRSPSTLEGSINHLMIREPMLKGRRLSFSVQTYLGKSYITKSQDFRFRTSNPRASWKVHAEIQLLFFYELHRADLPPRIFCASKSPCYLCSLFFDFHGRYEVPETHGRLYPGWILPIWLEQLSGERQADIGRVTDTLHAKLVLQIQQLVTKKRVPFNHPNESVLWTTANWSVSSLQSPSTKDTPRGLNPSDEKAQEPEAAVEDPEAYKVSAKHQGSPSSSSSQDQPLLSAVDEAQPSYHRSESRVGSTATILHFLKPGDVANIHLAHAAMELHIATRRLNLNFTRESFHEKSAAETCWIRCILLDSSELPRFAVSHQPLDIMSLEPGSEVAFEDGAIHATADLVIIARDEVLSIKYSPVKLPSTPGSSPKESAVT